MQELLGSAARTTTGAVEVANVGNLDLVESAVVILDVTAAATLAGDTLNLRIQSAIDDAAGAIIGWDDFISFTQVLGNGGAKRFAAQWRRDTLPEQELHPVVVDTLAAGVMQGPVGKRWRLSWVIAGTGSFTFRVLAALISRRV